MICLGYYWGAYGREPRCPADKPSWCICKWATARWIAGEGCNVSLLHLFCYCKQFKANFQSVRFLQNKDFDQNICKF